MSNPLKSSAQLKLDGRHLTVYIKAIFTPRARTWPKVYGSANGSELSRCLRPLGAGQNVDLYNNKVPSSTSPPASYAERQIAVITIKRRWHVPLPLPPPHGRASRVLPKIRRKGFRLENRTVIKVVSLLIKQDTFIARWKEKKKRTF